MKLKNKFISAIMVAVFCASFISMSVFAADGATIKLTGPTDAVKPGDTFTVTFDVVNNPGIIGMSATLGFDSEVFTLTKVTDSKAMSGGVLTKTKETNILYWNDDTAEEDYTADATYATLTFTVSETAANGNYNISLTTIDKDIINFECEKVAFASEGCTVTVQGEEEVKTTKAGFLATMKNVAGKTGIKFAVTSSNADHGTAYKEVPFTTAVESNDTEVQVGLNVTEIPEGITLTTKAFAY